MTAPRLAKALVTLRAEINAKWPARSKASDGWIGDASHAARHSDHNPNAAGVVCALDVTNDPAHGLDASRLAEILRATADPRLSYVISNGRIANPAIGGGAWRPYHGANPHNKHCHISVKQDASLYDDAREWAIGGAVTAPPAGVPVPVPARAVLKLGSKGPEVARAQTLLNARVQGEPLVADGIFGRATLAAVIAVQKKNGLDADGKIGAKTWGLLEAGHTNEPDPDALPARAAGPDFDVIVKHYEGRADKIYRIGGRLHGGYGHQLEDGAGWREGDTVPDAQIEAWFAADRAVAEAKLRAHIAVPLNQALFDAVASIVWNGGDFDDPSDREDAPLFWRSPAGILANLLNARDFAHVPFCIRALGAKPARDGKIYQGIVNRRLTEAERAEGLPYKLR